MILMIEKNGGLLPRLEADISRIKSAFGNSADLNIVRLEVSGVRCAVLTLEGMVKSSSLAKMLFEPLMGFEKKNAKPADVLRFLLDESVFSTEQTPINLLSEAEEKLCSGFAVVLVHGCTSGLAISAQGFDKRAVSEPDSEPNVKGTREALSDSLRASMALIRRRIKSPRLRFELLKAGKISNTELCLVYIDGKAPKRLIARAKKRLEKIKSELILTSGNIIPYLAENGGSFFSGVSTTERPDVLCAKINEGRIGVLIDGVPFAAVCPALFIENFQAVDDYADKPYYATYQRWIRFFAFFISSLLPGLYVASAVYHPEVLSRSLLLNLLASEERTPYPLVAEMFIVIVMFEILREAGIRLPRSIGGAVSIVGGLVIGDAAVTSGLISAPLLIIIGITATSAFVVPSLTPQMSMLRIFNVILGGLTGFFGIALLAAAMLVNACATDSFAVPYTAPLTPFTRRAFGDILTKFSAVRENVGETVEDLNGSEIKKEAEN